MEVQTELGGIKILQELNIHEISKDTASRVYVLTLGNSLDDFQQKHLEGNFEDFEINPKDALGVWGKKKLNDDFVSEMEQDGLLENLVDEGYARYTITDKGQEILDLYCIGIKILSQELYARAGELFMQADAIQDSKNWKYDTAELVDDIREAGVLQEIQEDKMFKTKEDEFFQKSHSKFNGVEKNRYYYHKFLVNQIITIVVGKLMTDFEEQHTENLENRLLDRAQKIDESEIKYLNDVLRMIRKDKTVQPSSIRLHGEDEEESFEILLEEAYKIGEIDDNVKETLEEFRSKEEFEEWKEKVSFNQ